MGKLNEARTAKTIDTYETPEHVLERVREVFGGQIDLDPFTSARNPTGARLIRTSHGFEFPWSPVSPFTKPLKVFCNPPYGPALSRFALKVVGESNAGLEIITLTPARPDTRWYDTLATRADVVAEIRGRLTFLVDGKPTLGKNGKPQSCQFPCALMYFGPNLERFVEVMSREGFARCSSVWRRRNTQR